jgi:hypothetical protein
VTIFRASRFSAAVDTASRPAALDTSSGVSPSAEPGSVLDVDLAF